MNYYRCHKLQKTYGSKTVLDLTELALPLGKSSVIIGPNGAGKTTLLKILAFLDTDYSGELKLAGEKVPKTLEGTKELRKRSTVIWQRPVMFNMSVKANVGLGLRIRGIKGSEADYRIQEALARLGLTELAGLNAKKLSGGEIQKVSLARSLVTNPDYIFVDEPSSNLDVESIDLMHRILLEEKAKGKTIILITHNLTEAKNLGDYAVFLNKGRLFASGGIPDVFGSPELKESTYWRYI